MIVDEFKSGLLDDATLQWRLPMAMPSSWTVPAYVDAMPYCLPPGNQGATSMCAAYALTTGWEAHNWRLSDRYEQLDPNPVYAEAKNIDGMPDSLGTTLSAVCKASINLGIMPPQAQVVTITGRNAAMYACHTRGGFLAGFRITEDWMTPRPDGYIVNSGGSVVGGHAVWVCGFSADDVWICNSWGTSWGWNGFAKLKWTDFDAQFMHGVVWEGVPR